MTKASSKAEEQHVDRATPAAVEHVKKALFFLGMNCDEDHPSIENTPTRFINYLKEFFQPYDLKDVMGSGFDAPRETGIHGMIVQSNIPFVGICEHHLVPFWGEAFIGYIPNKRIIGLSKMARLVDAIGHHKPGIQESMTEKIADAMYDYLDSKGSMVVIKAIHSCMSCRGVRAQGARTTTSCLRGLFRDVQSAREEFLSLISLSQE